MFIELKIMPCALSFYFKFLLVGRVYLMSTNVSQVTLVTAMDTHGVSNTNITPAIGIPIPKTILSDDTH